jgi:ATP-dependent helicase/nuclease subunit A
MVLTRRRTGFVNHLIKELRSRNIPVNGLDRLKLMEHKAIQDIVALINFLLYPKDDFNLAIVLKSPIYGMLEAELLELCYHRPSTLWEALTDKSLLQELIDLSRTKTIFEFFFYIFEYKEIRAKLIQEFDLEVNDVLDSFLDLILQFEAENISSLQLFLNYLSTNKTEIKRDLFTNKECLKVMTVHGAKGLQAPIVILADTTSLPHNADSIVWLNEQELIWPGREKYYSSQAIEAKGKKLAKDYAEYLRLLYVALTRAEDKLIICGISKDETISDKCWYSIIREVVNSDDYTKSPNTS